MSRCSKCGGCTNMFNEFRPDYCNDDQCPEGPPEPASLKATRDVSIKAIHGTGDTPVATNQPPEWKGFKL